MTTDASDAIRVELRQIREDQKTILNHVRAQTYVGPRSPVPLVLSIAALIISTAAFVSACR